MTKHKKHRRLKLKFIITLFIIFLGISLFSIYKIIKYSLDSKKTNDEIKSVQKEVIIEQEIDNEETKIVEQSINISKNNPYWDYINMNLIDVKFNELKNKNSDTKGWIQVNGTNINYPFVQTNNNKYYLTHSFDKSYNMAGWVFLDYRNNLINDKNTIIYAHGRLDKTMFGSLKYILKSSWFNNKSNYVIKLSTENENSLWQVFSIYHIPNTSDYLKISFESDDDFNNFTNMLINRSSYNFKTNVSKGDKILTLSTCYNNKEKMVLHAKLIKYKKK